MTPTLRVAVTGLGRQDVSEALGTVAGIETAEMSDVEAATAIGGGSVAYVVGVCESGGGAALAMCIAILGADRCTNLSGMGRATEPERLPALLDDGVDVFGVARDHVPVVVPALGRALIERARSAAAGA
jgi:pyrroline-5-carboxylate reductase